MSDFSNFPDDPVRVTEEASTFTESDVTVNNSKTKISGGSVKLSDVSAGGAGSSVSRANDDGSDTESSKNGLEVQVNTDLFSITVTKSTNTQNGITAFLLEQTSGVEGNVIAQETFSNGTATLQPNGGLTSGESYLVAVGNEGASYTLGDTTGQSYPVTSTDIDITGGAFAINFGGFITGTDAFGIKTIDTTLATPTASGDTLISFDSGAPTDIDSYDLATFQRTLDNETVTIDVEDSNGNVLKSDISKNTDISDIATSTDVQLRANFSRNDTSNNPTVDYLARRFTR